MWRAGFFLALPDETNIRVKREFCTTQGVERSELCHDRGLIVGRRTREDPIFAIDPANYRSEWRIAFPLGWSDRLSIVMRVEDDCVLRIWGLDLAIHHRISAFDF